jgi:hypothetical protein
MDHGGAIRQSSCSTLFLEYNLPIDCTRHSIDLLYQLGNFKAGLFVALSCSWDFKPTGCVNDQWISVVQMDQDDNS